MAGGPKPFDPLARLQKRNNITSAALARDLASSMTRIRGKIAGAKDPAYAASQKQLYRDVYATYNDLGRRIDKHLKRDVVSAASDAAHKAQDDSPNTRLVRFDRPRLKRYYRYVAPENGKSLAAVFTDKMADSTVNALRQSVIETEREAAIEGLSMNEKQKALQTKWDALTRDNNTFRFVDRSGKQWENARYLQMLTRTTAQRVYNDAYVDRLAESGLKLVRISSLGAPDCPVCKAWQGVICTIAGRSPKYPTLAEAKAAGVFHPNCLCTQEPVDEDLDADDMDIQAKQGKTDFEDAAAMQKRSDDIKVEQFKRRGLDEEQALDALTRSKVEEAIRTGTFATDSQDLANGLSHEQLVDYRENGVPSFRLAKKGDKVGFDKVSRTVTVDRNDLTAELEREIEAKPAKTNPEEEAMEAAAAVPAFAPDFTAREAARTKAQAAAAKAAPMAADSKAGDAAVQSSAAAAASIESAFPDVDFGQLVTDLQSFAGSNSSTVSAIRKSCDKVASAPDRINAVAPPTDEKTQATYDAAVADIATQAENELAAADSLYALVQGTGKKAAADLAKVEARARAWATAVAMAIDKTRKDIETAHADMMASTKAGNTKLNALLRQANLKK